MNPCPSVADLGISVLQYGFYEAWKILQNKMAKWSAPVECKSCKFERVCTSCPGEKKRGKYCGPLNTLVCQRIKKYIEAGIIEQLTQTL